MVRIRSRRWTAWFALAALACTPGPGGESGSSGDGGREVQGAPGDAGREALAGSGDGGQEGPASVGDSAEEAPASVGDPARDRRATAGDAGRQRGASDGDSGRTATDGRATATASQPRPAPAARRRPPDGHAWVVFGADTVVAELAISAEERAEGLMYREEVPDGTGMLFVFPDSDVRAFWMRNTYVDLDLAYMDAGFTVVDLQEREAMDSTSVPSAAPAMYVLEVRRGWFRERGLGVGSRAVVEFGTATRR